MYLFELIGYLGRHLKIIRSVPWSTHDLEKKADFILSITNEVTLIR